MGKQGHFRGALLVLLLGVGCAQQGSPTAWPQVAPSSTVADPTPQSGQILEARFVEEHPDDAKAQDRIEVTFDRSLDPLTLSGARFSIVGADRRVVVIDRAYLGSGDGDSTKVILQGRFGDSKQDWASSLALLPGLFGADGAPIATQHAMPIQAPQPEKTP